MLEEYGLGSMEHPRQLQRHQRTAVLMKIGDGGHSGDDSSCMPLSSGHGHDLTKTYHKVNMGGHEC